MITKNEFSLTPRNSFTRSHPRRSLTHYLPIVRAIKKGGPRYHVGSVLENRLGSQIFRVLSKHVMWLVRARALTSDVAQYAQLIARDGVLVIENFLPANVFEAVRNEYENVMEDFPPAPYKGVDDGLLYRTQVPLASNAENLRHIEEHFQNNKFLHELAGAVIRRPIKKPDIFLDRYKAVRDDGVDNDIENVLHADLHMPTVKMFFYLEPVNAENGAFIYAKGSHRLTVARLAHEYDLSVRQAKLRAGMSLPPGLLARRAGETRNIIDPKHYRRMNLSESDISVKANTLVVANNMGFHRRGEFKIGKERKAVLVNYRNSERKFF